MQFWIATNYIIKMLLDPIGRWKSIDSARVQAAAADFAAGRDAGPMRIWVYRAFLDRFALTDTAVPIEEPQARIAGAALNAAAARFAAGCSFRAMPDAVTGHAHTFSSLLYVAARCGAFFPTRLGLIPAALPPAVLPMAPPSALLWDEAASGPFSARYVPFCVLPQAGPNFPASLNRADFPLEFVYTSADYTTSRGLAARFSTPQAALGFAAVASEFWTLAFSRLLFQAPADVPIHAALAGGPATIQPSFLG